MGALLWYVVCEMHLGQGLPPCIRPHSYLKLLANSSFYSMLHVHVPVRHWPNSFQHMLAGMKICAYQVLASPCDEWAGCHQVHALSAQWMC